MNECAADLSLVQLSITYKNIGKEHETINEFILRTRHEE